MSIAPNSELDLPTLTQFSSFNCSPAEEASWVTGTREMRPGVKVSRTVVPDRIEDIPVRVVNLNKRPVSICAGTLVSDLEQV